MDVAAAREQAKNLRGSAREWLRAQPVSIRGDREVVLALVGRDGFALEHASPAVKADREVVLAAVKKGAFALKYAALELRDDRDFVLAAVQRNGYALACVEVRFQADRTVVLAAVREEGAALEYADSRLRADREIEQNPAAVQRAGEELRKDQQFLLSLVELNGAVLEGLSTDRSFVLKAVRRNVAAFTHAPKVLKEDAAFILDVAKFQRSVFQHLPTTVWENREAALAILLQHPSALAHAPPSLRADEQLLLAVVGRQVSILTHADARVLGNRDFMLDVVEHNAEALAHVAAPLRGDVVFNLAAARRNKRAIKRVDAGLWADRNFVLPVVGLDPDAFGLASAELRADRSFVLLVVRQQGLALRHAATALRGAAEVVEAAVSQDAEAFAEAEPSLRSDRTAVLAAVRCNGCALRHASAALRGDKEVVLAAVGHDGDALQHAATELRRNRGFVLKAVEIDGAALRHAARELQADRSFALQAVGACACAVQYVAESLNQDRDFVLAAACRVPCSLGFAPAELRSDRDFVLAAARANGQTLKFAAPALQAEAELVNAAKASSSPPPAPSTSLSSEALEALEARGIPVERLSTPQAAADLAEQWDRLEQLSVRVLREDCALLGLLPDACLEAYGRDGLVDHLKAVAFWKSLPLKGLQQECDELGLLHGCAKLNVGAEVVVAAGFFSIANQKLMEGWRGVVRTFDKEGDVNVEFDQAPLPVGVAVKHWIYKRDVDKLRVDVDEALREDLVERLTMDLFSDTLQQNGASSKVQKRLPVKQFQSLRAASLVLRRWEQLRRLSTEELKEEFRALLGIVPDVQRQDLEGQLMDAAAWAEMPLAGLQDACEKLSLPTCKRPTQQDQRLHLLERLHQSLCAHLYQASGVDLKMVGTIAAGADLLKEWERLQRSGRTELEHLSARWGLRTQVTESVAELQSRLKKVMTWNAMSIELLLAECRQAGVEVAHNQPISESRGERERLVRRLVAKHFAEATAGAPRRRQQPQPQESTRKSPQQQQQQQQQQRVPEHVKKHLQVLELPANASVDDVKRAYRRLALRHHPDKNSLEGKDAAAQRFCEVSASYEVLLEHLSRFRSE